MSADGVGPPHEVGRPEGRPTSKVHTHADTSDHTCCCRGLDVAGINWLIRRAVRHEQIADEQFRCELEAADE